MSNRGSISLEAAITLAMLLLLMGMFFSIIYGNYLQGVSYSEIAQEYIRVNHEVVTEDSLNRALNLPHSHLESGYELVTFQGIKDTMELGTSVFHNAVDYMTFITDTGSKFHKPFCPTVKLSLRPILYEEAIKKYQPCRVCWPKK